MSFNARDGTSVKGRKPPESGGAMLESSTCFVAAFHAPQARHDGSDRDSEPNVQRLAAEFSVANARLSLLVSRLPTSVLTPVGNTELLACVQDMARLHRALLMKLARVRELEQQVVDTQIELDHARFELRGTQVGEREARHMALHDALTHLPNRRYFIERLERALAHRVLPQSPLAVVFMDLDEFKLINDLHGHHVGDELLRIVGARLCRHLRPEDMVCRLGGDEFACLLTGAVSRKQLGELADKLFDLVAAPMQIDTLRISVPPSIGIALCPGDGATVDELLRHADAAMYRAKRRRSRHAFFDEPAS